jgi:hypothetical protein
MPMPDTTGTKPSNDDFGKIKDGWYQVKIDKYKERVSQKGNKWLKLWLISLSYSGFAWIDVSLKPDKLGRLKLLKDCLGLTDNESDFEKLLGGKFWAYCFTDDGGYGSASKIADIKSDPPKEPEEEIFYPSVGNDKPNDDDLPF